jgi:SAM-dependent methyltransferase
MDVLPDDPTARREWLERWAEEQRGDRRPASVSSRARRARVTVQRRLMLAPARVRLRVALASEQLANRVLDRGLDTEGHASEPEHDHPDRAHYVPSAWHVVPRALRYLGVSERDTFVDFGCGKGRAVHQAAKLPFRRVVGVEISPVLAEIARANLAAGEHEYRCRSVEIVVADATEFRVPDDLTIAYLFHPFKDETFEAVLRSILDSLDRHPRRVRLIYAYYASFSSFSASRALFPDLGAQVLATGRFRLLKEQRGRLLDVRPVRTAIFESL